MLKRGTRGSQSKPFCKPVMMRWLFAKNLRPLLLADLSKVVGVGISVHRKHLLCSPLKPIQSPGLRTPRPRGLIPLHDALRLWSNLVVFVHKAASIHLQSRSTKITANGPMAWKVMSFPFISHRPASSTTLLVGSRRGLNFSKSWTYRSHHGHRG